MPIVKDIKESVQKSMDNVIELGGKTEQY
jgi:hypothetical protein